VVTSDKKSPSRRRAGVALEIAKIQVKPTCKAMQNGVGIAVGIKIDIREGGPSCGGRGNYCVSAAIRDRTPTNVAELSVSCTGI
jgi:hypothetical protein